mmetsp:Transcript_2043/g.4176  ORF Transcript_2043/g.4176 Transcript_2043/m.4176 type:complete len:86 (+) Transcript_2043:52-309(+)|eukprot:CAMPEP_0172158926 /NCGR_PEP_ID=MMETSP1050-20130122/4662_1 /TAXON_ID=233186 /ORGANISM="Cryptomonas curvata, Strain CCAP979/52" /LENGTH=85 /DNA_ID=CAMNT_0012828409 /DNA_START=52 /DNA_END=309 /DNA_ORIENTATION=-
MGRQANSGSGVRAPDTSSKKKFDINRQLKENTGKFNYATGKRERAAMKAGKPDIVPKVHIWLAASVVAAAALLIAFFVWFMAQVE